MSVHSELLYLITCDYPSCDTESDVEPSLNELRKFLGENEWSTDGHYDYCPEHRDAAVVGISGVF